MILADTGPLVAAADSGDPAHAAVEAFLATCREPILVPSLVIAEACYFIGRRLGPSVEARFVRQLGSGQVSLEHPEAEDLVRAAELIEQYAGFPLGLVDASIVAAAERLNVTTLLTLDRRHFGAIQPHHCAGFHLVPTHVH